VDLCSESRAAGAGSSGHGPHRRKAPRRGRSERGAVLVEAALILPLLLALVLGMIDYGFTFNDAIAVRQGGREGLREAIVNTKPPAPNGTWNCPTGSGAPAAGTDAYNILCFTKLMVGLNQSKTVVKVYFTNFSAGQPVKICVQYKASSVTGAYKAFLDGKVLATSVESLVEQTQASMTAFAETSWPDGSGAVNWSPSCSQL
jgi:TadE-like protein